METTEQLLETLASKGGTIVNTAQCSEMEIAFAKAENRMYVNGNNMGFIWRPEGQKFINIQDNDCHWYYIPKSLKDEFLTLLEKGESGEDEFIEKFSDYMTGGAPHED